MAGARFRGYHIFLGVSEGVLSWGVWVGLVVP